MDLNVIEGLVAGEERARSLGQRGACSRDRRLEKRLRNAGKLGKRARGPMRLD